MKQKEFEVKEEHLKLISRMCVGWQDCEFGAPEINPKRPYGNSDVIQDIVEIFGLEEKDNMRFIFRLFGNKWDLRGEDKYNINFDYDDELVKLLDELHRETETALQIVLRTKSFETGKYVADEYSSNWRRV